MSKAVITINSPLCRRIVRVLSERGPLSIYELAPLACTTVSSLQSGGYLRLLKQANLVHVATWRKNYGCGGNDIKVWGAGPGQDAPKPPKMTNTEKSRHHRAMLREMYGPELARKMFRSTKFGGANKIVIDGRVIYERKPKARPACNI